MGSGATPFVNGLSESMAGPKLSVREAFKGSSVLVTGVTGYVGSLVLEQILRVCPEVRRVYVLIRGKRSVNAHHRLELLLSTGLFNKIWDKTEVLRKVRLLEGDVTAEDLGLHPANKAEVIANVEYVLHSAAAVALDDPIQKTLRNNYMSTYNVLELCKQMSSLKAYVHVSTAYVGITHPRGSVVKEKITPLMHGDARVTHEEVVTELLRLPQEAADAKAKLFQDRWNFPNTYTLGKHLAEQLVSDYHKNPFACAIVRPSLISGVDKDPYPGYIGNLAGGAGYAIAFAVGFFEENSMAWDAQGICDGIPGDIVSSVILAAAAATGERKMKDDEILIFHACSSTTYPLTNYEMHVAAEDFFSREPPPYCLLWGKYPKPTPQYKPHPFSVRWAKTKTWMKVNTLCWLLRRFGKDRVAYKLHVGYRAWDFANQERYDMNLYFSTQNTKQLDAMLVDEEKSDIRCLFTPLNGDWKRYSRTYLAGVKTLLLKSAVIDNSNHDFKHIEPRDPPISLPRPLERRPSFATRSSTARTPSRSLSISAGSLGKLGRSLSMMRSEAETEDAAENDFESDPSDSSEEDFADSPEGEEVNGDLGGPDDQSPADKKHE